MRKDIVGPRILGVGGRLKVIGNEAKAKAQGKEMYAW